MGIFSSKTVTTVSASASVNPLLPVESKKSGSIQYAITTSALKIGYTEYKKLDTKQGNTREIHKAYSAGIQTKSCPKFVTLEGDELTNPLDDYDSQKTTRDYAGAEEALDFMPMLLVKSDEYKEGIIKASDGSPKKKVALRMAKAMNVDLKSVTESIVGTAKIPQIGSQDWNQYAKAHRAEGGTESEATYRRNLVEGSKDKAKAQKDMTDVSIGYYGTFNKKATVMPEAMYYTLLSCLSHTTQYTPKKTAGTPGSPAVGNPGDPNYVPPVAGTPDTDPGTARRFGIDGELFSAVYSLNGYIHREVPGVIPRNKHAKIGYSTATVHLDKEEPIQIHEGRAIYNDYGAGNSPYFDKTGWEGNTTSKNDIPNFYVSIKVQTSSTHYHELVLVDFYQETTIEGKGKVRRSNSGNQAKNEKEMTWEEAYIAESFIPLTKSSMMKVKMLRRANLLIECKCHFIQMVNIKKTKKKWYQSGIFKVIMLVIAVVVFIYTGVTYGFQLAVTNMAIGLAVSYGISKLIEVLVDLGIISQAWAIALVAVVAIYGMVYASGLNIKMDFTMADVVMKTVEATGQVYAQELVKEMEEYQQKADKLQKEKEKLEEEAEGLDELHTSNGIGSLMADLQRMIDAVTGPLDETRDQFLARTLSKKVVTERLTYRALKAELEISKKG